MKHLAMLALIGAMTHARQMPCAGNSINGVWSNTHDIITFTDECKWTDSACQMIGLYPSDITPPSAEPDLVVLHSAVSSGCLAIGRHTCSLNYNDNTLSMNCAGWKQFFIKQ